VNEPGKGEHPSISEVEKKKKNQAQKQGIRVGSAKGGAPGRPEIKCGARNPKGVATKFRGSLKSQKGSRLGKKVGKQRPDSRGFLERGKGATKSEKMNFIERETGYEKSPNGQKTLLVKKIRHQKVLGS